MNSSTEKDFLGMKEANGSQQPNESDIESGIEQAHPQEEQYPPFKVVIPTILSLYLAVFLTALVSPKWLSSVISVSDRRVLGPHNHRRRHSRHIQRVPELRRHCLVRRRVSADPVPLPTAHGQNIRECCPTIIA